MRKRVENALFLKAVKVRRYYLHTRNNGTYYAEIVDPVTGTKLTARSTGTKDRDEAVLIIAEWLKSDVVLLMDTHIRLNRQLYP